MSQKELQRIKVVENAIEGRLSIPDAAELLQASGRQVKRLKLSYDSEDPSWVHHGNLGRQPAHAIPEDVRNRVLELAGGKYAGFTDSHLQDKLIKAQGLDLSRPGVRHILREAESGRPRNAALRNTVRAESDVRRKACCCRSMQAATIGWKDADLAIAISGKCGICRGESIGPRSSWTYTGSAARTAD